MPRIVISYRRSDTAAMAGRIFDQLTAHHGNEAVFIDIDKVPIGSDFRSYIRRTLLRADVLLAVIGPNWPGANADGTARIREEADPVRVEIETAFERQIPIIPVLIDGTRMPDSADLPASFVNFAYLNAAEVSSGRDFRMHMERLITAIDRVAAPIGSDDASALEALRVLADGTQAVKAADKWLALKSRADIVRYFLVPLVVLLVAHYTVVNSFNLNTGYLWLACVLVPSAAGFALFWIGDCGVGSATTFALALALVGVIGMSISEGIYSGDPLLPQTRFEWINDVQFAGIIALSFMIGHLSARALRAHLRQRFGKSQSRV
jgi:hypothetical protein